MKYVHGGDIYRNRVKLDFSVNTNPFGMPHQAKEALLSAVENSVRYPDIRAERLRKTVGDALGVPGEQLVFGNGASELFMAAVHAIRPKKTVIPLPSFAGYEYATGAAGGRILFYEMKAASGFRLQEDFFSALTADVDLLFLANPNNPTGVLTDTAFLTAVLEHCRKREIFVILDECFLSFCEKGHSMLRAVERFENLILVSAFTKIFAIPGVRLGYLVCGNKALTGRIERQLPEWNLSVFAQEAGCACAGLQDFIDRTADYVRRERRFLEKELARLGLTVFPGQAGFILFYSGLPLYGALLKRGILIRDCENFRGLGKGYYRIAVKTEEENRLFLRALGETVENSGREEKTDGRKQRPSSGGN